MIARIACLVGARPNFVKMASILAELRRREQFTPVLIHTGQHFSAEMSDSFFRDLDLPAPDVQLDVHGGSTVQQTAKLMHALEPVLGEGRYDLVLVVGDVNSTFASAFVASRFGIPVAHVEAGLRSFDRRMPEETNRILTDALSNWLFTTEPSGERNLLAEGIRKEQIHFVGNVMIDTLLRFRHKAEESPVLETLGLDAGEYAVATLHRPANVDDDGGLTGLFKMLRRIGDTLPVIFPVHPRTQVRLSAIGIAPGNVQVTPPLGYLDFMRLISCARLVLTDSGGIQEETTILGVPCLTLRTNTERPITITHGTNRLAGTDPEAILIAAEECLSAPPPVLPPPPLWDGNASRRIADLLAAAL
ncbi:MAG TPA: UDP-N-acetylglucosamine 2-epimerase (non-hydrolyzing) [Bryobacteraceae bacterium]|nr:UDP-N-acetylglucosamine 2-epimerase (non-hydrolyzing) [Bryobacteraceae bacterium]